MIKISKIPAFGDIGPHVLEFQKALKENGCDPGPLDSIFGSKVRAAASKFQLKIGLAGSGIVGPKTLKALGLEVSDDVAPTPITKLPHFDTKSKKVLLPALEALIDQQVEKNFLKAFAAASIAKDYGTLMDIAGKAMDLMNIREKTNKNDGYVVEMIQKVAGGQRGYAWCMYAVCVQIAWVEAKTGVVSKFPTTGSCAGARNSAPSSIQVKKELSQKGDVWIWRYSSTGLGHTGVFSDWKKALSTAILFEGNTTGGLTADGKIEREGGGFYRTERAYSISGMSLAMVCRPF